MVAAHRYLHRNQMRASNHRDDALQEAKQLLISRGLLKTGDLHPITHAATYAITDTITCGQPMGAPGSTNVLKVARVGVV